MRVVGPSAKILDHNGEGLDFCENDDGNENGIDIDGDNEEDSCYDSDDDTGSAGDSSSDLSDAHQHRRWNT